MDLGVVGHNRMPRLRRILRPLRRAVAWFALVDEERSIRAGAVGKHDAEAQAIADRLAQAEQAVAAIQATLGDAAQLIVAAENRATNRTDLVVTEALRRGELADARLSTALDSLTTTVNTLERQTSALLRTVTAPVRATRSAPAAPVVSAYTVFEEMERGSREEVVSQFRLYLSHFRELEPVVDLGCGRGEFLELADWCGLPAYGVDLSQDAVDACRQLGLLAVHGDLFDHLSALEPESIGGVFAAQVVEHLPPDLIWPLLEQVGRVLKPGGAAVLETPNPASFATHVHSFWRDPTHIRPVPPPALWFAARRAGLVVEHTLYSSPRPDDERLPEVDVDSDDMAVRTIVKRFNEATQSLNDLLFGPQNYAVVVRKPS